MKKLSLLLSEQILTESRVSQAEALMDKLFNKMDSEVEESKEKIRQGFEEIKEADPSGNQKYLQWTIKQYLKHIHNPSSIARPNISGYIIDTITSFHTLLPYIENKDINSYRELELVSHVVRTAKEKKALKEKEEEAKKQIDHVYEDDRWKVIVPKSHMASCVYGAGTQWCTASRGDDEHFKDYMRNGLLFYVLDKKKADREYLYKFAIHMSGESVRMVYDGASQLINVDMIGYDEQDNSFTLKPVLGLLPSEMITSMEEYISSGKAGEASIEAQNIVKKNIPFGQELFTDYWTLHEDRIDSVLYRLTAAVIQFGELQSAQTDFSADDNDGGQVFIEVENEGFITFEMLPEGVHLTAQNISIPYSEIEPLYNEYEPQNMRGVEPFINILYERYIEADIIHHFSHLLE
jgi:hypothetical protein